MTHFDDIRKACENHLKDNWNNCPIAYDNMSFDAPDGPWLRCMLRPVLTENAALGGLAKRDYASFWIEIFVKPKSGSGLAYEYAKELEILFSNIVLDDITFYSAETSRVGDNGNGWFKMNVRAKCWAQSNC